MSRWWMALPYLFGHRHEVGWRCRFIDPSATKKKQKVSFVQVVSFSSLICTSLAVMPLELEALSDDVDVHLSCNFMLREVGNILPADSG